MNATAYATTALDNACRRLASCGNGERGRTAFREAAGIGGLVHIGAFTYEEARSRLIEAAAQTGVRVRDAQGHVLRGLKAGLSTPRDVDDGATAWRNVPRFQHALRSPQRGTRHGPPEAGISFLWEACHPVTEDEEVAAHLQSRALEPDAIALWDAVRAIPEGEALPSWAARGDTAWNESGHRLLIPLFDHAGVMRSFRARCVRREQGSKTLVPRGHPVAGLVMACVMGRRMLAGDLPDWWSPEVIVAEGEMDWLTWIQRQRECDENGPAVLGISSGSWTEEIADRIPDGARVVVRTDHDASGEHYAAGIIQSLTPRCDVYRSRPRSRR